MIVLLQTNYQMVINDAELAVDVLEKAYTASQDFFLIKGVHTLINLTVQGHLVCKSMLMLMLVKSMETVLNETR